MAKGSQFEREFAVKLSEWWTRDLPGGPRSDIFWRSTTSGARATTRAKKGQRTSGQYGDITAIDPIGLPFLKVFTVEIKRGYSRHTIQDMVDGKKSLYQEWIQKVIATAKLASSKLWMLVIRRDQKQALVIIPQGYITTTALPELTLWTPSLGHVSVMKLEGLLSINPATVKAIVADLEDLA